MINADSLYGIGIDPGWKNLGLGIIRKDPDGSMHFIGSETIDASSFGNVFKAAEHVRDKAWKLIVEDYNEDKDNLVYEWPATSLAMERYVSYTDVTTAEAENILMLIGALYAVMNPLVIDEIQMYRAIDWKTELVKLLFKKRGFNNPSTKLDKKFSVAAANACLTDNKIGNDHEADAICLGSIRFIREEPSTRSKRTESTKGADRAGD